MSELTLCTAHRLVVQGQVQFLLEKHFAVKYPSGHFRVYSTPPWAVMRATDPASEERLVIDSTELIYPRSRSSGVLCHVSLKKTS